MGSMFAGASAFNQNLCDWKDAPALSPTCTPSIYCYERMFIGSQGGPGIGTFKDFDPTQCVSFVIVNKYDKFI